jgi:hypothetical protein
LIGTAYVWSPSSSGFYPESEKERLKEIGAWPSDGVEVTEEEYEALFQVPLVNTLIQLTEGQGGLVLPLHQTLNFLQKPFQIYQLYIRATLMNLTLHT